MTIRLIKVYLKLLIMKVVILCGGKGIRLRGYVSMPKSLIRIKGKPILSHIMEHYSHYGFKDFIICLGYRGDLIKKYFLEKKWRENNIMINGDMVQYHETEKNDWKINLVDTGEDAKKAERLKVVERFVKEGGNTFLVSYGDDLSNVNLRKLLKFHEGHNKIATLTTLQPINQYGVIDFADDNINEISKFKEKPKMDDWINGGFYVFNTSFFDYISPGDELEEEVMEKLIKERQLCAYRHDGFWKSMNTYKDVEELNKISDRKDVPWKKFEDGEDSDKEAV